MRNNIGLERRLKGERKWARETEEQRAKRETKRGGGKRREEEKDTCTRAHTLARARTEIERARERERGTERLVFATGRTLSKVNDSIIAMGGSRVVGTNGVGRSSRRSAREVQERIGPRKKVSPISVRTVRRDRFATSSSVLPVRCAARRPSA